MKPVQPEILERTAALEFDREGNLAIVVTLRARIPICGPGQAFQWALTEASAPGELTTTFAAQSAEQTTEGDQQP